MCPTMPETANHRSVREQETQRLLRLVAASRQLDAAVPEIDEVLQAHFHPSHTCVLALVRYLDDTCGIVWAAYHGSVYVMPVTVPAVLHRALQLAPPKVALRIDGASAHITATDVYNKPQTYQWPMPEW